MKAQEKIKAFRRGQKLTTYKLAEICGIPQSTVSKLENGRRRVDLDVLSIIAKGLKVNIEDLLDDREEDNDFSKKPAEIGEVFCEVKDNGFSTKAAEVKDNDFITKADEIAEGFSEVEKEIDITRDFYNLMSKLHSNKGPVFFNGHELEGENLKMIEHALLVAMKGVKQRKQYRK